MGVGQRPDRAVRRAGDAVAGVLRPRRQLPPQGRQRRERASSTSCSAGSRRRSCSTASPSSTAPSARRTSPRWSPRCQRHASRSSATTRSCSPASRCCSSGSGSRSPPCRSTCGRPTCTRARRRRSPAFMASVGKVAAFAALLRVFVVGAAVLPRRLAAGDVGRSPCCRSSSARSSPSCRPTSSGCSPTRRSPTPASSSSASRPPRTGPARPTAGLGVPSALVYLLAYAVLVVGTFAVVALVARPRRRATPTSTPSAGSAQPRPVLALALTVFLVAQAGVPFTSAASSPSSA